MLLRPYKAEITVHGCYCPGDMAVRMREVLAIPQSCVVQPLQYKWFILYKVFSKMPNADEP